MLKIAITGATGLVGSRIVELLKNDFHFIPLSHDRADICDRENVFSIINQTDFDIFLHLAGYTAVDKAESEKDFAQRINVLGTKNVFEAVKLKNKKFIYISTGFVFDGISPPYDEKSIPHPLSVYAKTKWRGEEIVKEKSMIVRIEYPYRAKYESKLDFVGAVKKLLEEKKAVNMVDDIFITPTFIDDIAYGLKYLFNNFSPEIFHLVGSNSLSPYEAGLNIAKAFNLDKNLVKPITAREYFKGKAERPKNAIIKSVKNNFYKMKTFEEGLSEVVKQLRNF